MPRSKKNCGYPELDLSFPIQHLGGGFIIACVFENNTGQIVKDRKQLNSLRTVTCGKGQTKERKAIPLSI